MSRDPFRPILITTWIVASGLALWGFTQAPPAQVDPPVQASVEVSP